MYPLATPDRVGTADPAPSNEDSWPPLPNPTDSGFCY
jgi:hypothetical protein